MQECFRYNLGCSDNQPQCDSTLETVACLKAITPMVAQEKSMDSLLSNEPLDSAQIKRINGVHRGFLYQHLVGVSSLLLASSSGLKVLRPEYDEDLELYFDEDVAYVQIKHYSDPLQPSDVSDILLRCDALRLQHSSGERRGKPYFVIFTSAELSPSLADQAKQFPKDVIVISPSTQGELSFVHENALPPPWKNLEEAAQWCIQRCEALPFPSLRPETLLWKLAGLIQSAAAAAGKTFKAEQLPELLELLVTQVQRMPAAANPYWIQDDEPSFAFGESENSKLIIGISGAGKTAWAANGSLHSGEPVVYFDVLDFPSRAVASALVRELAAALYNKQADDVRTLLLGSESGLQSLSSFNRLLERDGLRPVVVMDNIHRMEVDDLTALRNVAPSLRFIFLGQPYARQAELEIRIGSTAQQLRGLNDEAVGRVFADYGCPADYPTSNRLMKLTGGLPLFVGAAAQLCERFYAGNAAQFANSLESQSLAMTTGQEIIIGDVLAKLSANAMMLAVLLSQCTVPIPAAVLMPTLQESIAVNGYVANKLCRELAGWHILQQRENGALELHDAFRLVLSARFSELEENVALRFLAGLADRLKPTPSRPLTIQQFRFYMNLLPRIGQFEVFADLASGDSEYLAEQGLADDFRSHLQKALEDPRISPSDKFWALDTLSFWAVQSGEVEAAIPYIEEMGRIVTIFKADLRQQQALILKRMYVAGFQEDLRRISELYEEARRLQPVGLFARILTYTYALLLYNAGNYRAVESITSSLSSEYYGVVGLDPIRDVLAKNPPAIAAKLGDVVGKADELKRLADVLNLRGMALSALGERKAALLSRMHAHKFYILSDSVISVVKFGQDVVDDLVANEWFDDARKFLEDGLIPWVKEKELLNYRLPIMSQYAVVLARSGQVNAAKKIMSDLAPFAAASARWNAEYENQKRLIQRLEMLNPTPTRRALVQAPLSRKIGRNEPCPCGSGKKYKRCHGA